MVPESHTAADRLWNEYGEVFKSLDDLTLGRWMAQTLGQFRGRMWRLSHPLFGTYRLAIQAAADREIWQRRLIAIPHGYHAADCCAAPILPLFSRDIKETGLICEHCGETLIPFEDLSEELAQPLANWAKEYQSFHHVAHWTEDEKRTAGNYQAKVEEARKETERLLHHAATQFLPRFLEEYPTLIWEDQDECLDVRPEDIGAP